MPDPLPFGSPGTDVRAQFSDIRRALGLVWECSPGYTVAAGILVAIQGILPLVTLYVLKLVVDHVVRSAGSPDRTAVFEGLLWLVALAGLVAIVHSVTVALATLVRDAQGLIVSDHINDLLQRKAVEVDLAHYENPDYYDTLHRAQSGAPYRPVQVLNLLMGIGRSAISVVAMCGLLLTFHWALGLVMLAAAVPGLLIQIRHARRMFVWERIHTRAERLASYFAALLTRDTHAKEVRLFGLGDHFLHRWRAVREKHRIEQTRLMRRRLVDSLGGDVLGAIAVFGLFALMGRQAIYGAISIGDFIMYFYAVQRGLHSLTETLRGVSELHHQALFLSNLYDLLDVRPQVTDAPVARPVPHPIVHGIRFENVSFAYPDTSRDVLRNFNLTIHPGEHIALVGENGAGKTTIVKLLCRFYDPTAGRITIDGVDLREFALSDLRRSISVTFQDFVRYQLTARENITLGRLSDNVQQAGMIAAAEKSGADRVIDTLPKGYETTLGRWFEDGEELSVGQWQKMALARAFFKEAPIVALDEPTSGLDARAEQEVFRVFHELTKGRTAILISHRLSTVRLADCIYFLSEGGIVESGTHETLLEKRGSYADLFETQARSYR
jgi:ATP-binding cassette subfamily B protein